MVKPQLAADAHASIGAAPRRPILHHLNADSSWLLQLPIPSASASEAPARNYFNILIDPWLSGTQSDIASWFSQQWHATPCAFSSIAAVNELCREVDQADDQHTPPQTYIDAVAISAEFTDHCHQATLLELPRSVPVFAPAKAAKLVRSWAHFDSVVETPAYTRATRGWRETHRAPLPDWLGVARLQSTGDGLYFHSALVIAFDLSHGASDGDGGESAAECVVYTPHGVLLDAVAPLLVGSSVAADAGAGAAAPPPAALALLHGMHRVWLNWGQTLNFGAHNGLRVQRALRARYWVATHDEVKPGRGVVGWFLRRKIISLAEALDREKEDRSGEVDGSEDVLDGTACRELGNGETLVLV